MSRWARRSRRAKAALSPSTVDGWARLRRQLEGDGALDAPTKALLLSAVAAARGRAELLERELGGLAGTGGEELVGRCAAVLTLARGREAADLLAAAAGASLDWSAEDGAAATEDDVSAARDHFTPASGNPPAPVALLAEHAPGALVAYRELRAGVYDEAPLEPVVTELALFAIAAADYQPGHAAVHAGKAVEQGGGAAELVEAGLCAIPAAGMAAWLFAAQVIDELGVGARGAEARR